MNNHGFKSLIGGALAACARPFCSRLMWSPAPASFEEWRSAACSYSQFGEDLLVANSLEFLMGFPGGREKGFYVDVGANDPVKHSNTLLFHKRGWRGINVDPQPRCIARFDQCRPSDVNLCLAVCEDEGEVDFIGYDSTGTGRLKKVAGDQGDSLMGERPQLTWRASARRLATILRENVPAKTEIDFLSIDCEGADLEVLRSNDWNLFRPFVLAVEDQSTNGPSEIESFCVEAGYRKVGQTVVTKIFARTDRLQPGTQNGA